MSLGAISTLARNSGFGPGLLIEGFALAKPQAARPTRLSAEQDPSLARVVMLVESIRDKALAAVEQGGGDRAGQGVVDLALAEVAQLVGQELRLGGAENARVEGIDPGQVLDYEIRALRPNASASFQGVDVPASATNTQTRLAIPSLARLLAQGGSLDLTVGGTRQSVSIGTGTSGDFLATRLSRVGGLKVAAGADQLHLQADRGDRIEVVARLRKTWFRSGGRRREPSADHRDRLRPTVTGNGTHPKRQPRFGRIAC